MEPISPDSINKESKMTESGEATKIFSDYEDERKKLDSQVIKLKESYYEQLLPVVKNEVEKLLKTNVEKPGFINVKARLPLANWDEGGYYLRKIKIVDGEIMLFGTVKAGSYPETNPKWISLKNALGVEPEALFYLLKELTTETK